MTKLLFKGAILLLALLCNVAYLHVFALSQADAPGAIAFAKNQLLICYDSARQAESAGANISSLTVTLNQAGDLLSQSELAYSQDNLENAQNLAGQCVEKLGNIVSEAATLRDAATQQKNLDFWFNVVGSTVGTFAVIAIGFMVWRFLRKRYVSVEVETGGFR